MVVHLKGTRVPLPIQCVPFLLCLIQPWRFYPTSDRRERPVNVSLKYITIHHAEQGLDGLVRASQLYNQMKIFNGNSQVWDYLVLTSVCTHWPNRINYREICFVPFCFVSIPVVLLVIQWKLLHLERLRSEDTPAASWLPILLSLIGSQVKRRQSQSYTFIEFAKISIFCILKQYLHATHFLKLLEEMCK